MTTPTNALLGANAPALSAASILAGSTRLPSVEIMTFADADAEVVALLAAANSKRGKGEDAEREADFNVVVACELRDAILSTPPRTLADALAMLVAGKGEPAKGVSNTHLKAITDHLPQFIGRG